MLHVPLPDSEGRHEILQIHIRKLDTKLDDEVDLRLIAERTEGFSGADLANLCKRVGMIALSEDMSATAVYNRHFETAIRSVKEPPTITIRSVKAARTKQNSKGIKKLLFPAIPAIALITYAGIKYISTHTGSTLELART